MLSSSTQGSTDRIFTYASRPEHQWPLIFSILFFTPGDYAALLFSMCIIYRRPILNDEVGCGSGVITFLLFPAVFLVGILFLLMIKLYLCISCWDGKTIMFMTWQLISHSVSMTMLSYWPWAKQTGQGLTGLLLRWWGCQQKKGCVLCFPYSCSSLGLPRPKKRSTVCKSESTLQWQYVFPINLPLCIASLPMLTDIEGVAKLSLPVWPEAQNPWGDASCGFSLVGMWSPNIVEEYTVV